MVSSALRAAASASSFSCLSIHPSTAEGSRPTRKGPSQPEEEEEEEEAEAAGEAADAVGDGVAGGSESTGAEGGGVAVRESSDKP